MDLNPDTWGTVAEWVGGLGTTAAFLAAVVVIAKDAKVRKLAQARKVAYVTEKLTVYDHVRGATHVRQVPKYVLKNLSDEPIYDVSFHADAGITAGQGPAIGEQDVVLPGEDFATKIELDEPPLAHFRDNSNVAWMRNIKGKVRPLSNRRFAKDATTYGK
ncbi:hypothetical protein [Pseudarthrobacter scleromae]|uniref:hypothetical protein n=1 Tax=Pseudarthrobacter scleromae TaxID=158897 RepID=UPI003D055CDB